MTSPNFEGFCREGNLQTEMCSTHVQYDLQAAVTCACCWVSAPLRNRGDFFENVLLHNNRCRFFCIGLGDKTPLCISTERGGAIQRVGGSVMTVLSVFIARFLLLKLTNYETQISKYC